MKIKILPVLMACTLLFCSCGSNQNTDNANNTMNNSTNPSHNTVVTEFTLSEDDMFSTRDIETAYDEAESIFIHLNGTSAICDSDAVEISGSTVTITDEGTYVLSGTLTDGMIIVNAEDSDKPQLVFDNVTIHSEENAPLYILEADKVFVTLADGTSNTLSNGGAFTTMNDNNIDGTIYAKQDLTFNGTGSLTVSSPAGHGIVAKDDLVFTGGTYTITSASHGLDVNDSLRMKNTTLTITAGKDGAHVENEEDSELGFIYVSTGTFDINAEGDGLSASAYIQIEDGSFDIATGGGYENGTQHSSGNWGNFGGGMGMPDRQDPTMPRGGHGNGDNISSSRDDITATPNATNTDTTSEETESSSMKGIKATNTLCINTGTFTINSADDTLHSNTSICINGGNFNLDSGDDALHAEDTLSITNGMITINHSYEGLEALAVSVSGGDISIQSTDDGINAAGGTDSSGTTGGRDAMFGGDPKGGMGGGMSSNSNGSILISGGNIFMYAKGDGLDANGSIELTGGKVTVTGPTTGDTAILDYDTTATIDGATFIGVGSSMMAQTFNDGSQGTIAVQASSEGGTKIRIEDSTGNELLSYAPETAFQCVIISTPEIVKGNSYTISVGSQSGTFEAQ